ncbi:MAG: DNA double-strand break repair nuclease NurA [archaeon]
MIETGPVESILKHQASSSMAFKPSDVNLTECFVPTSKFAGDEEENTINEPYHAEMKIVPLVPKYPKEIQVVAIDSTSFTLGHIEDGIIGTIRASVIVKPAGKSEWSLEKYGPHVLQITEQGKDQLYQQLYRAVYGVEANPRAPDPAAMLDHTRALFERYIQQEATRECKASLIMLDGSLIESAVGQLSFFLSRTIDQAARNNNVLVAVSKTTRLILERSKRNILSLLEGVRGPCCVGAVRDKIVQNPDRYLGEIYVARLSPLGEAFRIDLPRNATMTHDEILGYVSGLSGEDGYPDPLRLAHMTCVMSAIEILELQAAAMAMYGLTMKEDLRTILFPL